MFNEISKVARCRWVPAAAVMVVMAGTAGLNLAAPAAASPVTLVNCSASPNALQPAIDGAARGEILQVTGTCTGPFTVSSDLTLSGTGAAVLDGHQAGPTVTVGSGAQVHLSHLTITNGAGGISNQGTLTVDASTVSGNTAPNRPGGGINNGVNATLTVIGSTLADNTAAGAGGGINNNGVITVEDSSLFGNSGDNCGGIANVGQSGLTTATVIGSSLHDNAARVADGGGICNSQNAALTLSDSTVYGNTADFGAGIYDSHGTSSVTGSTVTRNTASDQGGGIYAVSGGTARVALSVVEGNTANGGSGSGGGIFNASGTVTLSLSVVDDNNPGNCDPSDSVPGCIG
jgi:predicted outer membrane repeat protein